MITTQRKNKIPYHWLILITLPVFADSLSEWCGSEIMTFSMRKFINDPRIITFLHSFNHAFNFLLVPVIAWYSDRIWTRFGRRRPFILLGWAGMICVQLLLPMAPNIWMLGALVVLFHFLVDCAITGPYEPLIYEVVPMEQRGVAGSLRAFFSHSSTWFSGFFLMGLFDLKFNFFGLDDIAGEYVIYWTMAGIQLCMLFLVLFMVKEKPVKPQKPIEHFNPVKYFKSILSQPQWFWLYAIIFAQVAMIKGMGDLEVLLVTDQFGYSKAEFGHLRGYIGVTKMAVALLATVFLFADRFDRLKIFMAGVFLSTVYPIAFYVYVKFVVADGIPPLWAIVAFDCMKYVINAGASLALMPMLFDFIPKNKMSVIYSGTIFARGLSQILIANGMSFYVVEYSRRIAKLPEGQWDYMSGLHFLLVINLIACGIVIHFYRKRKRGELIEYGNLGIDETEKA